MFDKGHVNSPVQRHSGEEVVCLWMYGGGGAGGEGVEGMMESDVGSDRLTALIDTSANAFQLSSVHPEA